MVAAAVAKKAPKPTTDNAMLYLLGGIVVLSLLKVAALKVPIEGIKNKANIVPETGEFFSGLFRGAETDYYYSQDQSGSPNPPTQAWWDAVDMGQDPGPIQVARGVDVPTSPILIMDVPSTAEKLGGTIREFFTEGKIFPRTPLRRD